MTSTTKITLTALLLSLVTIAFAQGNDQPAVVGSPAMMGGPGQSMPGMGAPQMCGGPMRGIVPTAAGGDPRSMARMTLDFTATWDPSLSDMGAADLTQAMEGILSRITGDSNLYTVQVRQVQQGSQATGSAPATLAANVHVEFTIPQRDSVTIEQIILNDLKVGMLTERMTDRAKERQTALANQFEDADRRLNKLAGPGDNELRSLPRQIDKLSDECVSTDARVMALEEQILRMQQEAAAKIDRDPMVQELGEIVKIQEKALDTATPANMADARVKLAEARIALAQRKETIASAGGQLAKFSSTLADLSVERAVLDKELQAAEVKLKIRREELSKLRDQIAALNKESEETKGGFRIEKVTRKIEPLPLPAPGDRPQPAGSPSDHPAPPPAEGPGGPR